MSATRGPMILFGCWVIACAAPAQMSRPETESAASRVAPLVRVQQARDAYVAEIDRLRADLIRGIEASLKAVPSNSKLTKDEKAAHVAIFNADLPGVQGVPHLRGPSEELWSETTTYEAAARRARRKCRIEVREAAALLKSEKQVVEAARVLRELDEYCPYCVDTSDFVTRIGGPVDELRRNVETRSNAMAKEIRESLEALEKQAVSRRISAEDLTRRLREVLPKIERLERAKP